MAFSFGHTGDSRISAMKKLGTPTVYGVFSAAGRPDE
jgi:hypothetical protein